MKLAAASSSCCLGGWVPLCTRSMRTRAAPRWAPRASADALASLKATVGSDVPHEKNVAAWRLAACVWEGRSRRSGSQPERLQRAARGWA